MPFDANLLLLNASHALDESKYVVPTSLTREGVNGSVILDIKGTGAKGLAAVMVAPQVNVTYLNYLKGYLEVANAIAGDWERIASFPQFYQYVRKIYAKCTTPPVVTDIGKYLYGVTTSNDDGLIISFDESLYVANGEGYIYVAMVAVDDLFDDLVEVLSTNDAVGGGGGGTFAGTMNGVASVPITPGGIYTCRFATDKRYIRFGATMKTNANFQRVLVGLVPWPFKTL